MNIIIDTREQKPLSFTGHETCRRKLDEGDYNIAELIPYIVIERKSLEDLYGTIFTNKGHKRFKQELIRSLFKKKIFYLFIEGTLEEFYSLKWSKRELKINPKTMKKTINTMQERYNIKIIECDNRREMSKKIIEQLGGLKNE